MCGLAEVVRENAGRSSFELVCFFNGLIKSGELRAYSVSGRRLAPADMVGERQPFIVEDSSAGFAYLLRISSEGGAFYDDGDSQALYHHCVLERVAGSVSGLKVAPILSDPRSFVSARLSVDSTDNWASGGDIDYVRARSGTLVVEGVVDGLFAKVCGFVAGTEKYGGAIRS